MFWGGFVCSGDRLISFILFIFFFSTKSVYCLLWRIEEEKRREGNKSSSRRLCLVIQRLNKLAIDNQSSGRIGVVKTKRKKVMVGRLVIEEEEDEDLGSHGRRHPRWLKPMLKADYFTPCEFHGDSNKGECNMFCLDCTGNALCSYCLVRHRDHHIVQIRRSSYHNVVRVNEVHKYIDISAVQTYIINSAKIVFLNERPQPRPGKGVTNTCDICCRSLLDSFRFCSLGCKLGGIKRGDRQLTFNLLPTKHKNPVLDSNYSPNSTSADGSVTVDEHPSVSYSSAAYASPPTFNHTNSFRKRRRKGTPHRAPLK